MDKARYIFEKIALTNKLLHTVMSNKGWEMLAQTKQTLGLAEKSRALSLLPLSLYGVSGYKKVLSELNKSMKLTENLNKRFARTIGSIVKKQPSFLRDADKTRQYIIMGEIARSNVNRINKAVEGAKELAKQKKKLLDYGIKNTN